MHEEIAVFATCAKRSGKIYPNFNVDPCVGLCL